MKKITTILAVAILLTLVVALLNNSDNSQSDSVNQADPIKVGGLLSLSGPAAGHGEFARQAMELAASEINKQGGINGRTVKLFLADDQTDPKQAVLGYNKLRDIDKVDALIGGLWDFTAKPIMPLVENDGLTFISPSNARIPDSFELDEHSFTMLTDFSLIISELKDYLAQSKSEKLAVVRFTSEFGAEISRTLDTVMQELGHSPVIDETYNELGTGDFRTTITRLKQAEVDTVFLDMLDSDSFAFIKQTREQDFRPQIISHVLLPDALADPDLDHTILEGAIVLDWEVSAPEFMERFEKEYGRLPAKSAQQSYDAVYILAQAIANSQGKDTVHEYIANNSFETPIRTINFSPEHTVNPTPVEIQVIRNGQLETIN